MTFAGKVILVTGASSGIGAETAIHLSRLGGSLSITGRNVENLQKVADKCSQPIFVVVGDLTSENDAKNILELTIKHYGRLDVLVNNAGALKAGSIETTSLDQLDRMYNVNVRSVYHLTMLAVPYLIKTKGNIVNVSSVTGLRSFIGVLSYCMSKAALDQFTRCVALELAEKQIRVNSVNPGVVPTNLHEKMVLNPEQLQAYFERCKSTHALGRVGEVEEVASAIAFLPAVLLASLWELLCQLMEMLSNGLAMRVSTQIRFEARIETNCEFIEHILELLFNVNTSNNSGRTIL